LVGVKVEKGASPHLLLNHIKSTLGTGIHILTNSTAFLEKNIVSGSLKCNVVIEGPNNIGNYLYNNIIEDSRGDGLFLANSEKFLITNNKIRRNHNGILSVTSVVNIEENVI
jgi:parallel beta-helix repeat protein